MYSTIHTLVCSYQRLGAIHIMSTSKKVLLVVLLLCGVYLYANNPSMFASFKLPSIPTFSFNTAALASPGQSDATVVGAPDMTVAHINDVLNKAGSPARGSGQALYNGSLASGVKVSFALAVFKHESSYGTAGVARATHSLGNIRCSDGYACYQGYRSYGTWELGYTDFYNLIRNLYIHQLGLTTVGRVMPTYAPSKENATSDYITDVVKSMNTWEGK